jgi:two-component system, chemotaxis family, protein-glutamate methylesterase/glutaminase
MTDGNEYTLNKPDHLTCPECGGALAKVDGNPIPKYVCHIGHVLTGEAMLETQAETIERFLESALAMLNERRELCRQLLDDGGYDKDRIEGLLRDATRNAELLRGFLNGGKPPGHFVSSGPPQPMARGE